MSWGAKLVVSVLLVLNYKKEKTTRVWHVTNQIKASGLLPLSWLMKPEARKYMKFLQKYVETESCVLCKMVPSRFIDLGNTLL